MSEPKKECEIVQDLLPLYAENMVSPASKEMIEAHLPGCADCSAVYGRLKAPEPAIEKHKSEAESLKKFEKKRRLRLGWRIALIVIGAVILQSLLVGGLAFFLASDFATGGVKDDQDVRNYSRYMGEEAEEEYRSKWGMDQSIFPEKITMDMEVLEYRMTYYNPWDAQYLSYLTVHYDDADYEKELARLQAYESTPYKGYYGVTGFPDPENPIAMFADSYNGFVYAIHTPGEDGEFEENTITYVMIIFCNYFMDLKYEKYIPERYLPAGFNAHSGNPYEKEKMNRSSFLPDFPEISASGHSSVYGGQVALRPGESFSGSADAFYIFHRFNLRAVYSLIFTHWPFFTRMCSSTQRTIASISKLIQGPR